MDIVTFVLYTMAILELLFFLLTMYHLIKGLQTKNYNELKKYGSIYLILNFIRRIWEFAQKKAVSVSIIGGADGPTSIFLAGKVGRNFFLGTYLLWIFVILLGVAIVLFIRKKK